MTTLAAVLVRQRALPLETVEQAMLRQSLFGGDLATNLLELGSSDESTLLAATATALEAPAVAVGSIPDILPVWLQGLPPAQLLEDAYVPIGVTDTELLVATAAPLPTRVVTDLEARFGKRVELRAALEVRIREALSRLLGEALDERTSKLLRQLDAALGRTLELGGTPDGSTPEATLPDGESTSDPTASAAPTPRVSIPAVTRSLLPLHAAAKATTGHPRRLGPFTAAMAEIELASAQSPGDVITVWLDFAAQYFEYTAIFAVQGDIAAGKAARGAGTVGEAFSRIGVPLDLPSVLQRTKTARTWQLTSLEPRGLDRTLARDLGRNTGKVVLLVPVCIRERVVLLTYGDHGDEDVLLERVGDVLALQPLVERHLGRMLYERKRSSQSLKPPHVRGEAPPDRHVAIPPAAERANALANALTSSTTIDSPAPGIAVAEPAANERKANDPHEGQTMPVPAQTPERNLDANAASDGPIGAPSDAVSIDESWDLIQPVLSVGDGEMASPSLAAKSHLSTPARESSPPGSVWPGAVTKPGLVPKLELVPELDSETDVTDPGVQNGDAPAAYVQEAPSREPDHPVEKIVTQRDATAAPFDALSAEATLAVEARTPANVADVEEQAIRDRFERYQRGDASALDELIALGDAALGVLVRDLPGPVATPSRAPRMEQVLKASESGPLLRAIAAFGPAARPHLIARAQDRESKVRVWAIRLLGELPGRQSAICVAERIVLDRDAEVRRAAYLASQQLLRDSDSATALRQKLLTTAGDSHAVITQRLAAIDALADLRDTPAIPNLILLLADANPGTAAAAQQALSVLARQDFGYDARTWTAWWQANCERDRIEWVIDALDHRSPAIRQAASEELRLISRLYVGNFDDDSSESRAKVQKKYRDWWAAGARSPSGPLRS